MLYDSAPGALEIHLNITADTKTALLGMNWDFIWLKEYARYLGCDRIIGIPEDNADTHKFFKFAGYFGFDREQITKEDGTPVDAAVLHLEV